MMNNRDTEFWAKVNARLAGENGPQLWRSLEELAGTPEAQRLMEAEFPDLARPDLVDRRTLLRVMAASLALAGCNPSHPPLYSRPEGVPGHLRGRSIYFATTLELGGYGRGVVVDTHDGRPIRIDGNPLHPASLGAMDVFGQAEILSLYDPDRSRSPLENGLERDWETVKLFLASVRADLLGSRGRGVHILSEPLTSPTTIMLAEAVRTAYPEVAWHEYSPILDDYERVGAAMAFGRPVETVLDLTRADVVLSLGANLFLETPGHIRYAADFTARKRQGWETGGRPRLYVAETSPSITGASATERIILHPSEFEPFARAVLAHLTGQIRAEASHPAVAAVALALQAGSRGLVAVGRSQTPVVHAIAHAINAALGAPGQTLRYIDPISPWQKPRVESLIELTEAIAAGSVSHLLILGGNPAYDAPAGLNFGDMIRRVPLSFHLSTHFDETSVACRWHLPRRHPLESWGDLRAFDGTVGLRQPTTMPLVDALTPDELLGALATGTVPDGRELVRSYWRTRWADGFEDRWLKVLETGVVPGTASEPLDLRLREDWDPGPTPTPNPAGVTVTFTADPSVWDGRFANNGWLQELPRPLTKIVWGNAALIAPVTAEALGFEAGDIAELRAGELTLRAPVWPHPGQAPGTVTLQLGYGRWAAGRVGNLVGFNAYSLRPAQQPWAVDGVQIASTGEKQRLISTQNHHWIDGNEIIRTTSERDLAVTREAADLPSLYPEYPYVSYAWAMAIDLDACIGCNACVIACQSENNIPVIGPDEAARGRIMHWLRVDRYYSGEPSDPETYFQPVPCMHCEKAPCEVVCPVNATVHSSEGLNDMVYNRCIGTRTCSNNCPYKVRRFNWFDYSGGELNTVTAQANPEVTIRPRGVMEKCTYCVQRISSARIEARLENRLIRDGEVETACQSACPTRAIIFGDSNDPTTLVSRLRESPRNYALLGELNTQPRTTYLARVESSGSPVSPRPVNVEGE
ncbi:TAT-variant-translocated molybdopterin oxidoreductase [Microvirga roseola]|uniref:TAT-variant-translocated molybdopterin oxidoreductase n=1 Tax=Microvirga roseola TaxID=2883126 RepID=UPI001E4DF785|nr:TAT-variant-translocated molybdopterin oxidoreductase [Microvirga roseola]